MNRHFMTGFLSELEKRAFFGKKEIGVFQRGSKHLQKGFSKQIQLDPVPAEGGTEEKAVSVPGSAVTSATSMIGDIAGKVKGLKPLTTGRKS